MCLGGTDTLRQVDHRRTSGVGLDDADGVLSRGLADVGLTGSDDLIVAASDREVVLAIAGLVDLEAHAHFSLVTPLKGLLSDF